MGYNDMYNSCFIHLFVKCCISTATYAMRCTYIYLFHQLMFVFYAPPPYYPDISRIRNICEFCTTSIPAAGTSVSPVRPCHYTRGLGTIFVYLPGTSGSSIKIQCLTRNSCDLSDLLPVPGTSVSAIQHSYSYPKFSQVMYARATTPVVQVPHSYTFPYLL